MTVGLFFCSTIKILRSLFPGGPQSTIILDHTTMHGMKGLVRTILTASLSILLYRQLEQLRKFSFLEPDPLLASVVSRRTQQVQSIQRSATFSSRDPLLTRLQCGKSWDSLKLSAIKSVDPFIWSVSGGAEYRKYAGSILKRWERVDLVNVLVVALDQETADHLCKSGYNSVIFDRPLNSYSKVADAKLQVAQELASAGLNFLFIEMDIWCRSSPLPDLMELDSNKKHDVVVLGHLNNHDYTNIGMYYVRASERTAYFFKRLGEILAPSLHEKQYTNEGGRTKDWFDQDIFNWCLKHTQFPQVKMGNETNPCASVNVSSSMVSNLVVSSNNPPVVVDQTKCIHPLSSSPFSSFKNKFTVAKTLGFDLSDVAPDEQLLKTASGEMTYYDHLSYHFTSHNWSDKTWPRLKFVYHFSALVALAKMSNRTLVLPHSVITLDTKTLRMHSLVNLVSVERHVPWRWQVPSDLQDKSTIVIDEGGKNKFEKVSARVQSSPTQLTQVDGILFLKIDEAAPEVMQIMKNLTWCLDEPGRKSTFWHGHDWLCDDTRARPFDMQLVKQTS